ncbi:hypothetical protein HDU76_006539 [Blyttiomyces sp. JEL0837]|nr:hypothetical protein HDU76_006539 [Blyttiomyces sp. JEL0837]
MTHWIDFVAGTIGGAAGVVVGHPLDTIKVRLQTQAMQAGPKRYTGTVNCLLTIVREEKFSGLYKGMASPLIGVAVINSLLFGVYGWFLHHINGDRPTPTVSAIFWAGCASGLINAFVSCPMELVKIRLQNQHDPATATSTSTVSSKSRSSPLSSSASSLHSATKHAIPLTASSHLHPLSPATASAAAAAAVATATVSTASSTTTTSSSSARAAAFARSTSSMSMSTTSATSSSLTTYHGPVDCCVKIYKQGGIRGFYRGLHATVWRETPSYGAYFASYEIFSHMFTAPGQPLDAPSPGLLMAGGLAGIVGWLSTYPIDVVKTRIQSDLTGKPMGLFNTLMHVYRTEGSKALFSGLGATAIRAFPTNAATFYAVTWVKSALDPKPRRMRPE